MPYPATFLRLVMKFSLPGGEVANTTCAWAASSPLVSLDDATATALAGRATSWFSSNQSSFPTVLSYVGCSVSWIGLDGKTLMRIDKPSGPTAGGSATSPLPNEVATVMSLRTALAGRRTRGRMFLPAYTYSHLTAQGRWDSTIQTQVVTTGAALLAPLTVGAEVFTAVVASATGTLLTPVTVVACGDVPDSQRRRRDRLIEGYVTHTVP